LTATRNLTQIGDGQRKKTIDIIIGKNRKINE